MKIVVDGGLRKGTDVFKALALGADGLLMGRAVMTALAGDGASGVTAFNGITEELRRAICRCTSFADVDPSILWAP